MIFFALFYLGSYSSPTVLLWLILVFCPFIAFSVAIDSMNIDEFRNVCTNYQTLSFQNITSHFANRIHVKVHISAFETFCKILEKGKNNVTVCHFSKLRNENHIHLLCSCSHKQYFEYHSDGICTEWIRNYRHQKYILDNFFFKEPYPIYIHNYLKEDNHDILCHMTLGLNSLKEKCAEVILRHIDSPQSVFQWNLPKNLEIYLFEKSNPFYQLPKWKRGKIGDIDFSRNQDFNPNFVAGLQYRPKEVRKRVINLNFQYSLSTYFLTKGGEEIKACSKCAKVFLNTTQVFRKYWLEMYSTYIISDPLNWCFFCKQEPLFKLLEFRPSYHDENLRLRRGYKNSFNITRLEYFPYGFGEDKETIIWQRTNGNDITTDKSIKEVFLSYCPDINLDKIIFSPVQLIFKSLGIEA